jgi:hypothetical protein
MISSTMRLLADAVGATLEHEVLERLEDLQYGLLLADERLVGGFAEGRVEELESRHGLAERPALLRAEKLHHVHDVLGGVTAERVGPGLYVFEILLEGLDPVVVREGPAAGVGPVLDPPARMVHEDPPESRLGPGKRPCKDGQTVSHGPIPGQPGPSRGDERKPLRGPCDSFASALKNLSGIRSRLALVGQSLVLPPEMGSKVGRVVE